jgi:hypothetical protein
MILGWLRLIAIGYVVLTVIYWLVSIYSRSVRRERLEKKWDAGEGDGEREDFVARGMEAYEHGFRRRMIWLVYVIPTVTVLVTLYLLNFG